MSCCVPPGLRRAASHCLATFRVMFRAAQSSDTQRRPERCGLSRRVALRVAARPPRPCCWI
eukprot:10644387-Alexandrium_andersonii.AAC.1